MAADDPARSALRRLLPGKLDQLRSATGLAVAFAGVTEELAAQRRLVLTEFRGTVGTSLHGLNVELGRGVGGAVVARGVPVRVNDYAKAAAITHDYDRAVVQEERITSLFAFPLKVHGAVYGVLYGAVRDVQPIGDVALRNAGAIAAQISRELSTLTQRSGLSHTSQQLFNDRGASALEELARLAATVTEPGLRRQLTRIHRELAAPEAAPAVHGELGLTPRELEVLRLVSIGLSNRETALRLDLGQETVKSYLRAAMRKLDVNNRTGAVHAARRAGLL